MDPPKRRGPVHIDPETGREAARTPDTGARHPPEADTGAPEPVAPAAPDAARSQARRGAVLIEAGAALEEPAPDPGEAEPVPDADGPGGAMAQVLARSARRSGWFGRLVRGAVLGLVGMMVSVAAWDFVAGLMARNLWLGAVAGALGLIALAGVLVLAWREVAGLSRLTRIDGLRAAAEAARRTGDRKAAAAVLDGLARLYGGRADLAWAGARMGEQAGAVLDADGLLDLAEREYLTGLDAAAAREIEAAARQVAVVTAVVPLALADVAVALIANLRMIRRIAEIYGGRSGTLGSWRLMRGVAAHLVATGAVAVGDDLLQAVLGGGLVAKLSRRFGEGVVNGALTARVGLAALDICRPLPFAARARPNLIALLRRALTGLWPGA